MPVSFFYSSAHLAYIGNGKVAPAPVMSAAKAVPTALLANVTAMTATGVKKMRSGFIIYLSTGVYGTGRTLGANDDNSVTVGPRPPRLRPQGADSSLILSPICHEAGTQWRVCRRMQAGKADSGPAHGTIRPLASDFLFPTSRSPAVQHAQWHPSGRSRPRLQQFS